MPPQYYNGADPVTSFTDGLARGFELVEGIRERRQMRELREREAARADEALKLQQNQDARAQKSSEREQTEFDARAPYLSVNAQNAASEQNLRTLAAIADENRRPKDYEQRDKLFDQQSRNNDLAYKTNKLAYDNALEAKAATADYVDNALLPSMQSPLAQAARGPASAVPGARPAPQPTNYVERRAPQAGAPPASVGDTQVAPADLDLRNAPSSGQRVADTVVAPFKAAAKFVDDSNKKRQVERWNNVAEGDFLYAAQGRNIAPYVGQYLKYRDGVKPENRAKLDYTVKATLSDELKALPNTPKNAPRIREINDQLKQLDRAQLDSLKTDVRRPVSPSDPKVEQALAPFQPTPGTVPVLTSDQFRALNVQLDRVSGADKVDGRQLKAIARARKAGVIDDATLNNWRQYGRPLAPAQPKITSVTGGFVVQTPNGYTFVSTADGTGADKAAKLSAKGVENLLQSFKGEMAAGRLPGEKNSEYSAVNDFITVMRTGDNAAQFKQKTGFDAMAGGQPNMAIFTNPAAVREATEVVARMRRGIQDEREGALVPEGDVTQAVSSMPAAPSALQPGFVHSSGYVYLGGDPGQPSSWQAPQQ